MISSPAFPRLTPANHQVTSPPSSDYNCVAWAAGDTEHWWQPGIFWPQEAPPDDYGVAALEKAFRSLGYEPCDEGELEEGFEKVVLYGAASFCTHIARQLASGRWTSKLGRSEDIEHDTPDDVAGGVYGKVVMYLKRPLRETQGGVSE